MNYLIILLIIISILLNITINTNSYVLLNNNNKIKRNSVHQDTAMIVTKLDNYAGKSRNSYSSNNGGVNNGILKKTISKRETRPIYTLILGIIDTINAAAENDIKRAKDKQIRRRSAFDDSSSFENLS